MQNNKLYITDERMFRLIAWAIDKGIVDNETEFCKLISFTNNNIDKVKKGAQSFRKEHIRNACQLTGASADYIFGFTNQVTRKPVTSSLDKLKEAVAAIEIDLKRGNRTVNKTRRGLAESKA